MTFSKLVSTLSICTCLLAYVVKGQTLNVAAASNLQPVLEKINQEFERQTSIHIVPSYGSTGKLLNQIEQGAPFDVLLSADEQSAQRLFQTNKTTSAPTVFAFGKLVLCSTTMAVDKCMNLNCLLGSQVIKIAIANPQTAPYGLAAQQAMQYYGLLNKVQSKIVLGENIAQAAQFVFTGAADAGIIAESLVLSKPQNNKINWIELPKNAYSPVKQTAVIILQKDNKNKDAAIKYIKFLQSPFSRAIFVANGYSVS